MNKKVYILWCGSFSDSVALLLKFSKCMYVCRPYFLLCLLLY